jgi:hypothetical protein
MRSLAHIILGVEGHVGAPKWGLGKLTRNSIILTNLHKPNSKSISAQMEHFWCTDKPWTNKVSQDSARPKLERSHHLHLYNILCALPWDQHPNVILSRDSQVGVPKFPKLGLLWFWRPISLCAQLRWGLQQIFVALKESFPTICGTPPTCKGIKTILNF